jgi:hypothetical protein
MRPSEIDRLYLEEITASRYPVAMDDQPPLRIDITGVGQPTTPEEVGPAPDDLSAMATQMAAGTEPQGATPMSLAEFATSAADVPAGLLKGVVQGSIGLPGDIISLVRGVYDLGRSGGDVDAFLGGLEKATGLPTTEDVKKFFDETLGIPLVPAGASERRREAAKIPEFVGELGGAGKTAIEGTKAAVRGINVGAMAVADKAVQAITGNPQATAMGALEAAGQMSPVSRIAPGVKAQAVQPIKDDSRLLMPAFLEKTKKMESGFIKLNSPIKMKDGSTLSGFESADQKVFYGRDKNGVAFNVPREYVNPDDFVSSRDGNKTMEKIKANLVESRSPGLTLDVAPSATVKLSNKKIGEAFNRLVNTAKDDFEEVMSNWQSGVFLNDDKDKLITYPGRDQAFSRGKEGGKVNVTKKEMIEWLMSDGPFDEKIYGPDIRNDKQWVAQIERLRSTIKGEQ